LHQSRTFTQPEVARLRRDLLAHTRRARESRRRTGNPSATIGISPQSAINPVRSAAVLCPAAGSHRQQVEGASAEPYWPAVGHDPETADRHHRGASRKSELLAMIVIDIFKENHRSSH